MKHENIASAGTETASRTTTRRSTATTEARIGAVRNWLEHHGRLYLKDDTYREFRWQGFSRSDLDRCIDLMAERCQVIVETRDCMVAVRLAEGPHR